MNTLQRWLSVALLLAIVAIGCQKELSESGITNTPVLPTPNPTVTTSINGRIIDEDNKPIVGATVMAGVATSQTNINGEFTLNNVAVEAARAFVQVTKAGYFRTGRLFIAAENQRHFVEVQMLKRNALGTVSAATGGLLTHSSGASIVLPQGGFVHATTGAAYSGQVTVDVAWINPTGADLHRQMPGDLRGVDSTGREVGLTTFGMIGVELTGSGGEKLQIAPGRTATLTFPIPSGIQSVAPNAIDLWSFSDSAIIWKKEGRANRVGNNYVAQVSHFSFWNCDAPFQQAILKAKFVDQSGNPLRHYGVKLTRNNMGGYAYGFTDTSGVVRGIIPVNEALTLQLFGTVYCGAQVLHTQNVPPANGNVDLGTITVNTPGLSSYTVSGSVVNCSNTPVANGYVDIRYNNFQYVRAQVTNGTFSASFSTCSNTAVVNYYAVDGSNMQQGSVQNATLNAGSTTLPSFNACGTSVSQFINLTYTGASLGLSTPQDSIALYVNAGQGGSFMLQGTRIGQTPNTGTYFQLNFNATATGAGTVLNSSLFSSQPPFQGNYTSQGTINITEFGTQPGSFIAGTFLVPLRDSSSNVTVAVNGTFRARRN
jgi:hypothetical protein